MIKKHIWWCKRHIWTNTKDILQNTHLNWIKNTFGDAKKQITLIKRHIWFNVKDILWNTHLNWTKDTFDDAKDRLRLSKDTFELTQKTYYKTHIWIDQKAHLVMQNTHLNCTHYYIPPGSTGSEFVLKVFTPWVYEFWISQECKATCCVAISCDGRCAVPCALVCVPLYFFNLGFGFIFHNFVCCSFWLGYKYKDFLFPFLVQYHALSLYFFVSLIPTFMYVGHLCLGHLR